ncbi:site-specific DNA-methyltransferase [Hoeflea sp. G2-23]|uniref:Methyltransferase n=1 Tax=Hoeflea algicola TaxID=2983763 RepID=A0ABT3ZGG7_9HYPH|nr:site-specific DNA-methyltransferase [Hoeflea algicola]MCY0150910.1 site-specific DNA-methyltransferase [Hoeflea algicola]
MTNVLDQSAGTSWNAYNADTVEFTAGMPTNSIDLSVYSPPFSSLYIYSESERDMGNVDSHDEFFATYRHLIREKLRITKPGRLTAIHVKDLVFYSNSSEKGDRGLYHFTGECIRVHVEEGWTFHRLITIWRCPVKEMQKTKSDRLLYKNFRTDAARTGGGMPEYIAVFRKWNEAMENTPAVVHPPSQFPLDVWQEWASPVWMDTHETNVLNVGAKNDEERHLCPMPLDLTQRIVLQYSNPGETVYSPFMGIGSEGVVAVREGRKFLGTELKPAYFKRAVRNLQSAEENQTAGDLLDTFSGDAA